jgi:polar amino acid transport system substrate-binding protein
MRYLLFVFCCFYFSMLTTSIHANESYLIVSASYPPYQYEENGDATGLSTQVVKEAFDRAGVSYSIKFMSWARAYETALNTPNVFIYSIARTSTRENLFKWAGQILESPNCLISLRARKDIALTHDFESLKNHSIGAVRGDLITTMLENKGLQESLDYVSTDIQNIQKLHRGRVDLVAVSESSATYISKQIGADHTNLKVHFCPKSFAYKFNIAANIKTEDGVFKKIQRELEKINQYQKAQSN